MIVTEYMENGALDRYLRVSLPHTVCLFFNYEGTRNFKLKLFSRTEMSCLTGFNKHLLLMIELLDVIYTIVFRTRVNIIDPIVLFSDH